MKILFFFLRTTKQGSITVEKSVNLSSTDLEAGLVSLDNKSLAQSNGSIIINEKYKPAMPLEVNILSQNLFLSGSSFVSFFLYFFFLRLQNGQNRTRFPAPSYEVVADSTLLQDRRLLKQMELLLVRARHWSTTESKGMKYGRSSRKRIKYNNFIFSLRLWSTIQFID